MKHLNRISYDGRMRIHRINLSFSHSSPFSIFCVLLYCVGSNKKQTQFSHFLLQLKWPAKEGHLRHLSWFHLKKLRNGKENPSRLLLLLVLPAIRSYRSFRVFVRSNHRISYSIIAKTVSTVFNCDTFLRRHHSFDTQDTKQLYQLYFEKQMGLAFHTSLSNLCNLYIWAAFR